MPAAPPLLGSTGSTTFVLAALLVVLGLAMIVTAVWLVRATRTDVSALGPLEVMGDRRFVRHDADERAATLAAVRPEGAPEPAPMVEIDEPGREAEPEPEPVPEAEADPEPADEPADAAEVSETAEAS